MAAPWRRVFPGTFATAEAAISNRLPGKLVKEAMLGASTGSDATAMPAGVQAAAGIGTAAGRGDSVRAVAGVSAASTQGNPAPSSSGSSAPSGSSASLAVGVPSLQGPALGLTSGVLGSASTGSSSAIGQATAPPYGVSASASVGTVTASGGSSIPATAAPEGVQASVGTGTPSAFGSGIETLIGQASEVSSGSPSGSGASSVTVTGTAGVSAVGLALADGGGPASSIAYPQGVGAAAQVGAAVFSQAEPAGAGGRFVPYAQRVPGNAMPSGVQAEGRPGHVEASGSVTHGAPEAKPYIPTRLPGARPENVRVEAVGAKAISDVGAVAFGGGGSALAAGSSAPVRVGNVIAFAPGAAIGKGMEIASTAGGPEVSGSSSIHALGVLARVAAGSAEASGTSAPPPYDDSDEIALALLLLEAA